jgi:hypothetical protein
MKKRILIVAILLLSLSSCFSQRGRSGFGIYGGYGFGKYSPGLGNLKSTMYLFDQQYGADFKYNDYLSGPAFGFQIIRGFWQTDFEWILRHSVDESSYTDPVSNTEWKMGFKTRYNTLFWGNAFRYKNFAIGAGLDIGRFKIFNKNTPIGEYDDAKWDENTIYGSKIALSKFLAITSGWIFYADYMPRFWGVRVYYALPMNSEDFGDDATLRFYTFKPSNVGITLFLNLSVIK